MTSYEQSPRERAWREAINAKIAATVDQVSAACHEAGMDGVMTEWSEVKAGGARCRVSHTGYWFEFPNTVECEVMGYGNRSVTYKEPLNLPKIVARMILVQKTALESERADAERREQEDAACQQEDANKAALAAMPHDGLSCAANAEGIDLLHLTPAQFAVCVGALSAAGMI